MGTPGDDHIRRAADELAAGYLAEPAAVGLAVGVVAGGRRHVFGYGKAAKDSDRAPDERTVFEIGSVTKVFTAVLLAEMAGRGEVRLDQPVQELLPAEVRVPAYRGRPITLAHLAEHTSALPRLPANLDATVKDDKNPYKDYEVRHLYEALNQATLAFPPGSGEEYSNLGAGLLGHALGLRAGKPYEDLLADRVLGPLGLGDTAVGLSAGQAARLAPGHDERGDPTPGWDFPTLAGAGALRSTVGEMLTFLQANLDPGATPLAGPLEACQAARPVARWRRLPVGAWAGAGLAAASLLAQRAVPVPPGSDWFVALGTLPVLAALFWKGLGAGAAAAALLWAGSWAVWGPEFGPAGAAVGYLIMLGAAAVAFGYLPPRRVRLGWQAVRVGRADALWHNGGTGGYCSFVGLARRSRVGVAVLANSAADGVDAVGVGLLRALTAGGKGGRG